jgi:xanthine dehydrogenase small subunit
MFDPLERTRSDIVARLWAMQGGDTISIASGEERG